MKTFKAALIHALVLCTALLLGACATETVRREERQPDEQLIGFYYGETQDKRRVLYVLGESREYALGENKTLSALLRAGALKHTLYSDAIIEVDPQNRTVAANYRLYLDAEKTDRKALYAVQSHEFAASPSYVPEGKLLAAIRERHPGWQGRVIMADFAGAGQVLKISNREALLAKHRLKYPVRAKVLHVHEKKKVVMHEDAKSMALMPVAVIAAPFAVVAGCASDPGFIDLCPFR